MSDATQHSEAGEPNVSPTTHPIIIVREATRTDVPFILQMIRELATYERAPEMVQATVESLTHWIIDEPVAACLIASLDGQDAGIALYFKNFSTWDGVPGIYLEDLIVREQLRGCGIGHALLRRLAQIVVERGFTRLEWSCLDWN
jgi:GNAT superfamily N-acetyltransferase